MRIFSEYIILLLVLSTIPVRSKDKQSKNEVQFTKKVVEYRVGKRYLYRLSMGEIKGNASHSEHHYWPSCTLPSTIDFTWDAPVGELVSGVDMDLLTGAKAITANSTTGLLGVIFDARIYLPATAKKTLFSVFVYTVTVNQTSDVNVNPPVV